MSLDVLDQLLQVSAFAHAEPSSLFADAVSSCRDVLCSRFPRYAEFLQRGKTGTRHNNSPLAQARALPALFLPVLKTYQFPLSPDVPVAVRLTSSGTTGRPSVTPLDEASWQRRVRALCAAYDAFDLFRDDVHVLAFLMDPATTRVAGSVVIDAALREMPQVRSVTYLARMGSAGPEFQPTQAAAALAEAAACGPVLLVGYPALIAAAIQALLSTERQTLPLPEGSGILTGGGWKSFLPGVSLDQHEFRARASAFFQLPPATIRDMFGLSECPAVFVQCEQERYHVPAWAWAQAIDPETGEDVPPGSIGLLQLTVPLTTSYPLLKILTTDKVTLETGCLCRRPAPFLTPHGRVTAARFETCAMKIGRAVN